MAQSVFVTDNWSFQHNLFISGVDIGRCSIKDAYSFNHLEVVRNEVKFEKLKLLLFVIC